MPEKVLVFSRFPKTLMQRIGEKFELLDAGGKPPNEMFPADELAAGLLPTAMLRCRAAARSTPSYPVP